MNREASVLRTALPAELICCLLGSCAFCTALLPALGQEVGMGDCMLFAAVDLSLIFLLSRRWWLAPALLAFLALAGLGAVWLFRLRETAEDYVRGFIEWYNAAFPYTLPYSVNGSLFLVRLAYAFPVTLLLYLYFRRLALLPVWAVLGGALLLWMYSTGAEELLPVLALLLIVLFVLLARTNSRSINRRLGAGEKLPAAAMQLTALALAPFAVLFAFALGPKEDGAWQSRGLVNLVEDLRDVFSFYGEGSGGGSGFDLVYSGLTPNAPVLGGDIAPDNKTVLRVRTETPILLAGAVYDGYTGSSWYDAGALGRFRFTSPLWRGKRREVFTIDKPGSGQAAIPFGRISKSVRLEITPALRFRAFFGGGKLEKLSLTHGDDSSIYFNTQGELFTLELPAVGGAYTLRTRVFDREHPMFDAYMRQLTELAAAGRDREYAEILLRCAAVPDTVEQEVRSLTEELVAGCETAYDKALAIETWLGENCVYTRTPGDVPEGREFVSWFLESREGYCTYFASAMAVMARLAGLPARYVTGYGLKQADRRSESASYVATNATAHAWCQIYFYGVGWVDFDPTHWNAHEPVETDPPKAAEPKPEPTPAPAELPEPELPEPPEPELPEERETAAAPRKNGTGKLLLIILGADLAAFLIFLLLRFILLFFRVESFYYRLARRYPDNAARADECYRQLLKQLGFLGLAMEPADTILSFCARADAALAGLRLREPLEQVCRPVLLSRFALRQPTDEEVRRMCDCYIALERSLRRELGLRKYVLHRMLLGR